MVLSDPERACAATLLKYVSESDLKSMALTVSKGMVTPTSPEECLKIILYHSESQKSLLAMKKISKKVLFKYLHDYNVLVEASLDKHELRNTVIQLWEFMISGVPGQGELGQVSAQTGELARGSSQQQQNSQVVPQAAGVSRSEPAPPVCTEDQVNELAVKFSEWFYKLLNTQEQGKEKLGPEHFWQDCSVVLKTISPSDVVEVSERGAEHVVKLLHNTKHDHKLYFHPNLTVAGVRGKLDPHGLVMVFACGTLHQVHNCVGLFEQMFLLARDPFSANNWKVKSTKLQLTSAAVQGTPTLQDESISQLMVMPDQR